MNAVIAFFLLTLPGADQLFVRDLSDFSLDNIFSFFVNNNSCCSCSNKLGLFPLLVAISAGRENISSSDLFPN